MRKVKIGLLGCSSVAYRSVLPAINANSRFKLVAIGSRSPEKSQMFANKFGGQPCTYDEVLQNEEIDSVYISVPVGLHFSWANRALDFGKHVLVEKTFTQSLSTASALIEKGAHQRLIVMEALSYVFHPLFSQVQSIVSSGRLGHIRHIEAQFGFPYLPENDIRNQARLGGGAILDALIYPLSFCLYTFGHDPKAWHSNVVYDEHRQIDTRGFIQIDWENRSAQIAYGFGLMYRNTYTIWGEEGYLSADRVFSRPRDFSNNIQVTSQGLVDTITSLPADQFSLMLDTFADHILGGSESTLNVDKDILRRMRMISELYEQFGGPDRVR